MHAFFIPRLYASLWETNLGNFSSPITCNATISPFPNYPQDRYAFAFGGSEGEVTLVSALRGEVVRSVTIGSLNLARAINSLTFSPDGSKVRNLVFILIKLHPLSSYSLSATPNIPILRLELTSLLFDLQHFFIFSPIPWYNFLHLMCPPCKAYSLTRPNHNCCYCGRCIFKHTQYFTNTYSLPV